MRKWIAIWLASLVIVAGLASAWTRAQGLPQTFSGSDIGFRVDGSDKSGVVFGQIVVRINGKWVETRDTPNMPSLRR